MNRDKLERIPEYVTMIVVITGGLIFAALAGRMTGSGQVNTIAAILLGGIGLSILMTLRQRVWMLIPLTFALEGQMPVLPVPFSLSSVMVMAVTGMFLALIALKAVRTKANYGLLDVILLVNLLYLVSVFIRNPVGTAFFGSERVGGKPYADVAISVMAWWVLSRAPVTAGEARTLPFLMLFGYAAESFFGFLSHHIPATSPFVEKFYRTVFSEFSMGATDVYSSQGAGTGGIGRLQYVNTFSQNSMAGLCAYFRPLTLINPLFIGRFLAFMFMLALALLSGHRSVILATAFFFAAGSYFRGRMQDLFKLSLLVVPLLVIVLFAQGNIINLPFAAQRSLSFLPGKWSYEARQAAEETIEWRLAIWKAALTSRKYIYNRVLGDGFGFSMQDMQAINRFYSMGLGSTQTEEQYLIVGGFHNGPISGLRVVGAVGLALFYILMILMARQAVRLYRRCRGTPLESVTLFLTLLLVYQPIRFTFIQGGMDSDMPHVIIYIGLLKLLERAANVASETRKVAVAIESQRLETSLRPGPMPVHAR